MKRTLWILTFLLLMVTACQTQVELTETVVPTVTMTATATLTATLEPTVTRVPRVTLTPTVTRTPVPTLLYQSPEDATIYGDTIPDTEPITIDNIGRLELLAEWGLGRLYDAQLTKDETQVVAGTALGIYWFDAITLGVENFVPHTVDVDIETLRIAPSTETFSLISADKNFTYVFNTEDCSLLQVIELENAERLWYTPEEEELFILVGAEHWSGERTYVWDLQEQAWTDRKYPGFYDISFGESGDHFVANLTENWRHLYEYHATDEPKSLEMVEWQQDENVNFDLSDDGRYLFVPDFYYVNVWDLETGQLILDDCLEPEDEYHCPVDESNSSLKNARPSVWMAPYARSISASISSDNRYLMLSLCEAGCARRVMYRYDLSLETLISKERIVEYGRFLISTKSDRYYFFGRGIQLRYIHQDGVAASVEDRFAGAGSRGLTYSPEGGLLAVAGWDEVLRLYDARTGDVEFQAASYSFLMNISFARDVSWLFSSGWTDELPVIIDYVTGEIIDVPVPYAVEWARGGTMSVDGQYVEFDRDGLEHLYHVGDEMPKWQEMEATRFHPFKTEMAVMSENVVDFYTYNGAERTKIRTAEMVNCHDEAPWGYLPSGNGIYCVMESLEILKEGDLVPAIYENVSGSLRYHPDFSPDDQLSLQICLDGICVIELETGVLVARILGDVVTFDLSPNGKYLAVAGYDGIIRIWGVPVTP